MDVNGLFEYWRNSYYSIPFGVLIVIIGIGVILLKNNQKKLTHIFIYYFIAYFILSVIMSAHSLLGLRYHFVIGLICRFSDCIFTVFEFVLFSVFFKKILKGAPFKRILRILFVIFSVASGFILIYDTYLVGAPKWSSIFFLYNIEAISLLILCIFYYVEIFRRTPILNLLQEPSFWVVTGLSFVMISTLPFSLLSDYIINSDKPLFYNLFSLFYIFYSLLFLMIVRGHLCRQPAK